MFHIWSSVLMVVLANPFDFLTNFGLCFHVFVVATKSTRTASAVDVTPS
jgi:hypothetical protein